MPNCPCEPCGPNCSCRCHERKRDHKGAANDDSPDNNPPAPAAVE